MELECMCAHARECVRTAGGITLFLPWGFPMLGTGPWAWNMARQTLYPELHPQPFVPST